MTLDDRPTDEDRREETHLLILADDFTSEETWRLVRWCREQGADEFTVDFNNVGEGPDDPFRSFARSRGMRQHLRAPSEEPWGTTLYRLDEDSIRALQAFFPSGLFHGPSYGSDDPWAEDPVLYRNGRLMLGVTSHEYFGELSVFHA